MSSFVSYEANVLPGAFFVNDNGGYHCGVVDLFNRQVIIARDPFYGPVGSLDLSLADQAIRDRLSRR